MKKSPRRPRLQTRPAFDVPAFLNTGVSSKRTEFRKKQILFTQGEPATHVFYIQEGSVKFAVTSAAGKEAIVAIHELSDRFISYMVKRNLRTEEDLIDQLFNSTEKRLARTLLLLARYGKPTQALQLPKVSQGTLAEIVGTTRTRVNFFMNKFRNLGYIEYDGVLKINNSLLSVVLRD